MYEQKITKKNNDIRLFKKFGVDFDISVNLVLIEQSDYPMHQKRNLVVLFNWKPPILKNRFRLFFLDKICLLIKSRF